MRTDGFTYYILTKGREYWMRLQYGGIFETRHTVFESAQKLYRDWGRITAPSAMTFDTIEDAMRFMKRRHMEDWGISEYDVTNNNLIRKVYQPALIA